MGTPIFLVKRASNSQDTVDYIVQRAARKNSSGFPGLIWSMVTVVVGRIAGWSCRQRCPSFSNGKVIEIKHKTESTLLNKEKTDSESLECRPRAGSIRSVPLSREISILHWHVVCWIYGRTRRTECVISSLEARLVCD